MIARCYLPVLALLGAVVAGWAPEPAVSAEAKALELKPKWAKGDTARFEMVKTQTRESDGKEVRKVVTRTAVAIEVVEIGTDGTAIRWTQGTTVFDDPKLDDDPAVRALNGILKNMEVDLELDPNGLYTGVRNWKELRATGHKVQDAVLAQMAKTGTAKATIDLLRKEGDKYFASKESVEATFGRQPALLFLPFGRSYDVGKTVEYETTLPNVLGGDEPFPASGEATLKAIDKDTNVATLVFKEAPDPKEMPTVIRKWLEDVAKKTGKPAPKELPELELRDVIECQFDLTEGWVKSVTHTRTAKQTAFTQTDVVTLTRKK